MKRTLVLSLCAAGLLATGIAVAETGGPAKQPRGARLEQQLQKLDLTSEQKTKVEAILAAGRKQRAELQGRLNQDLKDLRASLRKDPPDEQAVLGQAEKIGALRTEQHKVALRTRLKVQAELTPQQREKLKQLRRVDREGSVKGKTGAAPPAGD